MADNGIFLEREDTHARIAIRVPEQFEPGDRWQEMDWMLPSDWWKKPVRLIAIDHETRLAGWLGISSPRAMNLSALVRKQLPTASVLIIYPFNLLLFLLPGLAIAFVAAWRRETGTVSLVILTVIASSAFGYAAFWAYFASNLLGQIFSFIVIILSGLSVALLLARSARLRSEARKMAVPFLYVLTVGLCYLCLFFVFGNPFASGAALGDVRFFNFFLPGDNIIPLIFADKIFHRESIEPFCCGGWLSSDRPPLQAGIFLLQRPLKLFGDGGLNYQVLGTALQCLSICGVWCLLKTLRTRSHRIRQVLGFLVFSGFFFYNTLYTWPKLLAATFILFVLTILFRILVADRPITTFETFLASMSFSLALMAHPGSIFSLPAFFLILIPKRRYVKLRQYAFGAIVIALFVAPWAAYQKYYDPPGNRLLKMHLAGVQAIDSRSTWKAVRDAYTSITFKTYYRFKRANITNLIGREPLDTFGLGSIHLSDGVQLNRQELEHARLTQQTYIWNAIGIVNAGWPAALWLLLLRKKQRALRYTGFILTACLVNFILWSMVMFAPRQTIVATSSFADILLLFIGLCGFLLVLPRMVVVLLFVLQLFSLFLMWILSPPNGLNVQANSGVNPVLVVPLLIVGLGLALRLAWHFGKSYFQQEIDDTTETSWPQLSSQHVGRAPEL